MKNLQPIPRGTFSSRSQGARRGLQFTTVQLDSLGIQEWIPLLKLK